MNNLFLVSLSLIFLSACATKQYPQAPRMTTEESSTLRCEDIKVELAKARSIQYDIEETGDFDGKTVLGFLGDFGIGNGIAKSDARKKARERLYQLEQLQVTKCKDENQPY